MISHRTGVRFGAFILGMCAALAFAPLFIMPVVVFSLAGLLFLLERTTLCKESFIIGWCYGFGYFLTGLYWISYSLLLDIENFAWMIPFALIGIPAILAFYIAIVAFFTKYFGKNLYLLFANFVMFWLLLEMARANFAGGYPWLILGYALAGSDAVSQIASLMGVYGLSFVMLCLVGAVYFTMHYFFTTEKDVRKLYLAFMFLTVFVLSEVYGQNRLNNAQYSDSTVNIRVVQPNFPQELYASHTQKLANLSQLVKLSILPSKSTLDYIIWPEGAMDMPVTSSAIVDFTSFLHPHAYLLTGAIRVNEERFFSEIWNSVFAINRQGKIVEFYDKVHLVPFGEYIPFKSILQFTKITEGVLDFSSGVHIKSSNLPNQSAQFVPLICYEAYFAEDINRIATPYDFMINFTNDAWYGSSSGPYQHLAMSKIRAIEQGKPMVRVAKTGISAVINEYGMIINEIRLNQQGVIDVKLAKSLIKSTFYKKYKNIALLIVFLVAVFVINYKMITKLMTIKGVK